MLKDLNEDKVMVQNVTLEAFQFIEYRSMAGEVRTLVFDEHHAPGKTRSHLRHHFQIEWDAESHIYPDL